MIDFFDPTKNPFMSMMYSQDPNGTQEGQSAWTPPMPWMAQGMEEATQMMTQMFQLQMQFALMMWMMPMHLMQGMAGIAQMGTAAQKKSTAQPGGFQLGGMTIPPEMLQKLLQMEMSPENLEKLQKVLNFMFAAIPKNKDVQGDAGED